ncbi:GNAT family N-acetyltransferase [Bacillus sp. AFS053548]|uniref:GNAT family N-acetyltransferase n=1 Tax=Bacillus sp. AFS053548 TaxID=2033505 RepID=UPI000BFE0BB5|nr:GNAT family N-acetyltransferase [Bacillus sp. AFS053548]PGM53275.1 hypothetical protein CN946_17140 [Bacillus sp. AFS053548]
MNKSEILLKGYKNVKKLNDNTKFIGLKQTKLNDTVLLYVVDTSSKNQFSKVISVLTYIDNQFDSHSAFVTKRDDNTINDNKTMYILDIKIFGDMNINRGYGSIIMNQIIKIAKNEFCTSITGNASAFTSSNKIRQNNFYQKFGFIIHENRDIRLNLSNI